MATAEHISQEEINAILWRACDTFRGTIDPAYYKDYILVMLFVKYISDAWRDRYAQLQDAHGADESRILRQMRYERFNLPDKCDFYTLYEQRNEPNIGELINIALEKIEDANKQKLEGVFRNIDFNSEANLGRTKQRNDRLKNLLTDFHNERLDMRPSRINGLDIIGNAYEYLIGKFASGAGKKAGEFYTPPEVSTLLARLLNPQPGDRIADPACGSGSLLIKCAKQVGSDNYSVYGQENNGSTWALCMMNMFLHNINSPRIEWGDTLQAPTLLQDEKNLLRFNVVVANPPFSLDKWGAEQAEHDRFGRYWRGVPPKSKGDYAFITHMIEATHPHASHNGRVGVIIPHGVLFRGSSEGAIRQKLIEENLLDAVIGLPPNLFYGTGIPAAILIFKRQKPDNSVLFIDASREYEEGTPQNRLRERDLDKIVQVYDQRQFVEKYAYVATVGEIAENDYNLNIPRYVDTFEEEAVVDIPAVQRDIKRLRGELADVEAQMEAYLRELGLDD